MTRQRPETGVEAGEVALERDGCGSHVGQVPGEEGRAKFDDRVALSDAVYGIRRSIALGFVGEGASVEIVERLSWCLQKSPGGWTLQGGTGW